MSTSTIIFYSFIFLSILFIVLFTKFINNSLKELNSSKNKTNFVSLNPEVVIKLKKIIGKATKSLTVLKYTSLNTKEEYENEYPSYYKIIEDKLFSNENFTYNRILQVPMNIGVPLMNKDRKKILKLMMDHVIMKSTLQHISKCIESENFRLFIVPVYVPYSLINIDDKILYRKIDEYEMGFSNFDEIENLEDNNRLKNKKIKLIKTKCLNTIPYSKKELVEGVNDALITLKSKLDSSVSKQKTIYSELFALVEKQDSLSSSGRVLKKIDRELNTKIIEYRKIGLLVDEARKEYKYLKTNSELLFKTKIYSN